MMPVRRGRRNKSIIARYFYETIWTSTIDSRSDSGRHGVLCDAKARRLMQSLVTEPLRRSDILSTIRATGTVEPEELVDVGAQVMGLITGFGKAWQGNQIDYNSVVKEGTELAYIDKTPYSASLEQAEATLNNQRPIWNNARRNSNKPSRTGSGSRVASR